MNRQARRKNPGKEGGSSLLMRFATSTALLAVAVVLIAIIFFHAIRGDIFEGRVSITVKRVECNGRWPHRQRSHKGAGRSQDSQSRHHYIHRGWDVLPLDRMVSRPMPISCLKTLHVFGGLMSTSSMVRKLSICNIHSCWTKSISTTTSIHCSLAWSRCY